jgi:hypothetical protein
LQFRSRRLEIPRCKSISFEQCDRQKTIKEPVTLCPRGVLIRVSFPRLYLAAQGCSLELRYSRRSNPSFEQGIVRY